MHIPYHHQKSFFIAILLIIERYLGYLSCAISGWRTPQSCQTWCRGTRTLLASWSEKRRRLWSEKIGEFKIVKHQPKELFLTKMQWKYKHHTTKHIRIFCWIVFKTLPEQRDLARIMVATILQWRWTFKEQRHQARLQGNHNGMSYLADKLTDFNFPLQLPIVERWRASSRFCKTMKEFLTAGLSFTHIFLRYCC